MDGGGAPMTAWLRHLSASSTRPFVEHQPWQLVSRRHRRMPQPDTDSVAPEQARHAAAPKRRSWRVHSSAPLFDSGASRTMHPDAAAFSGPITTQPGLVYLGDGHPVPSMGSGTSVLGPNTLHVPALSRALISAAQDDRAGLHTVFGNGRAVTVDIAPSIPRRATVLRTGTLTRVGTYELTASSGLVAGASPPPSSTSPVAFSGRLTSGTQFWLVRYELLPVSHSTK
jgi:hypothetical protein